METRMSRPGGDARAEGKGVPELSLFWGDTLLERVLLPAGSANLRGGRLPDEAEVLLGPSAAALGAMPVAVRGEDGRMLVLEGNRPGPLSIALRQVSSPARAAAGIDVDMRFARVLAMAIVAGVFLLAALAITPLSADVLGDQVYRGFPHTRDILFVPPPPRPTPHIAAPAAPAPAGKAGKQDEHFPAPSRRGGRVDVSKLGLLAASAQSAVFDGGLNQGIKDGLDNLKPGGIADEHGISGLSTRGDGPGGGPIGSIGVLTSRLAGPGTFVSSLPAKSPVRIVPGKTTVVGALSKDIIGKVIRQHENQIRHCYEEGLQQNPELQGKVTLQFVIDGAGGVSDVDVADQELDSAEVSDCMKRTVARWRFPEPAGGGVVVVTYPWIFHAAGTGD